MKNKHFIPDACKFCCKAWEKGCNGVWDYEHCEINQQEKERLRKKKLQRRRLIEISRTRFNG